MAVTLDGPQDRRGSVSLTVALAASTIGLSVSMININKFLMQAKHFPYAAPLVLLHMGFCSVFAFFLRLAVPWLFPALTDPDRKVEVNANFVLRGALPIGIFFAASLVCGNLAYMDLSVAFLQMMKEFNIVLVYLFSLMAALETFSVNHLQVIMFAIIAGSLTIRGELNFSLAGFLTQLSSQFAESFRIVLQSLLLSGQKLDAMTYVLIVSPICFLLLGTFLSVIALFPVGAMGDKMALPPLAKLHEFAPLLLASCVVAFALNVSIALLVKYTSATSYIFCGVVKDLVAVLTSVAILKESVSLLQCISFSMQVCAVIIWSMLKTYPDVFRDRGIVFGMAALVREGPARAQAESLVSTASAGAKGNSKDGERRLLLNKPAV